MPLRNYLFSVLVSESLASSLFSLTRSTFSLPIALYLELRAGCLLQSNATVFCILLLILPVFFSPFSSSGIKDRGQSPVRPGVVPSIFPLSCLNRRRVRCNLSSLVPPPGLSTSIARNGASLRAASSLLVVIPLSEPAVDKVRARDRNAFVIDRPSRAFPFKKESQERYWRPFVPSPYGGRWRAWRDKVGPAAYALPLLLVCFVERVTPPLDPCSPLHDRAQPFPRNLSAPPPQLPRCLFSSRSLSPRFSSRGR